MTATNTWMPAEGDLADILTRYPRPLAALQTAEIPAIILRGAFNADHCAGLMQRFRERGFFDQGTVGKETQLSGGPYLDLGTSLGRLSSDPEKFFAHAARTHELFKTLFDGYDNPVQLIYESLSRLASDKRVMTAHQPDGRRFGPAIFRIYHANEGHGPHFDSVAKRSKLLNYAVSRFQHQFAGVLCLQSADRVDESGEPFIYKCPSTADVQKELAEVPFHEYVAEKGIPRVQVRLDPGDLYFFYTENYHEVPRVSGGGPRVVLAVFFGMSPADEEIFVWS